MKLSLAILTLNEIDGLIALWDKIPFHIFDETFIIDGGSTDGTLDFLKEKNALVYLQTKRGRGEAFRFAFEKSNFDITIIYSPDGNENPDDLIKFLQIFRSENPDMVIASRMMKGSVNEEDSQIFKWRKWANNSFNFLANLLFNRNFSKGYITDSINGFRGMRNESFKKLGLDSSGYTIEYQSTIRSFKKRMKIVEFPTKEGQRIGGESYAKSIPTGIKFLKLLFSELINK